MAINKIGVENFRVFKNYTEFEIRPITLLTGPNNAGKSSFTKLLLLLKNGIEKLNFETGNHNLESFDKVLNWQKKDDTLKLTIPSGIDILGDNFFFELEYKKEFPIRLSLANQKQILFDFILDEKSVSSKISSQEDFSDRMNVEFNFNFNITYLIDLIYNKELLFPKPPISLKANEDVVHYDMIKSQEKNYLLYDVKVNGKSISNDFQNKIIEYQNVLFTEYWYSTLFKDESSVFASNMIDELAQLLSNMNYLVKFMLKDTFEEEFENQQIDVEETSLGKFIFSEELFKNPSDKSKIGRFENTVFGQFQKFSKNLNSTFDNIDFLPANRGSQKRVLSNKSENIIDEVVLEHSKKNHDVKTKSFLKKILKILEIDGDVEVKREENSISIVYIVRGDKKINLADLGFGYSQIIPIILKIINHSHETLIIEEPEANLHPNLQSKLADVFATAVNFNPQLRLIIETHSEYFIRKLQYLTARNEIKTNDSVIYYFNADKYVTPSEPKVKMIEINEMGNFTDNFGPGFYDEATRLQFDLMKINETQHN